MASSAQTHGVPPPPAENYLSSGFYYTTPFSFERSFNEKNAMKWMQDNWTVSIWLSLVYIIVIFAGQWYMQTRHKYDLRPWLAIWSGILAFFSILATIRLLSEAIYVVITYGWDYSVCFPSIYYGDSAIWAWLFTVSKAYELGDTMFIILRKQPLIFLHWYHHVTVMIYSWYTYAYFFAPGRWFAAINSLVHSFMYTYYCLRALKIRVPKKISMSITFIQLSQMIFGIYVNWSAYAVQQRGDTCHISDDNVKYSILMYASYAMLFAHFFYNAYLTKKQPRLESKVNGTALPNGTTLPNGSATHNGSAHNGVLHKKQNEAFVTLVTTDTYGVGALVLAESLIATATSKTLVAMVTTNVSTPMRELLSDVYHEVHTVNEIRVGSKQLTLLDRPDLAMGYTKIYAWTLTQFRKAVFLDSDVLVVANIDDLFTHPEMSAAPDFGWPDYFNSGVFVLTPNISTFLILEDLTTKNVSYDGADQGLLNYYFNDTLTESSSRLSTVYNAPVYVADSNPAAFTAWQPNLKVLHYLGSSHKPWKQAYDYGSNGVVSVNGTVTNAMPLYTQWWDVYLNHVALRIDQKLSTDVSGHALPTAQVYTAGYIGCDITSVLDVAVFEWSCPPGLNPSAGETLCMCQSTPPDCT